MAPRRDPAQGAAKAPAPNATLCLVKYRREAMIEPGYQPGAHSAGTSTRLRTRGVSMASLAESTRFLTVERVSALTGIPIPTLQRQLRAKLIPGAKWGRRWLIPAAALTALEQRALQGGKR
jgi:excisionase family DNA binding protein